MAGDDDPPHAATDRLPTLTEVVELGLQESAPEPLPAPEPAPPVAEADVADVADAAPEEAVARVLLADIERHIDALFERRLREALAPALARVADSLIREARQELAPAVRELVEEAVARAQQRPRRE
jgi:hypothetical protein